MEARADVVSFGAVGTFRCETVDSRAKVLRAIDITCKILFEMVQQSSPMSQFRFFDMLVCDGALSMCVARCANS